MLKISTQDEPHQLTLKLEGSLVGSWVIELEDSWRAVNSTLAGRTLCVHLNGVDQVDNASRYLLEFFHYSGVQLTAEGIVKRELVRTIAEDWGSGAKVTLHEGSQSTWGKRKPN
jgi:hypothetical protein